MNVIRGVFALLFVVSIMFIFVDWSLSGEAPHPGGGTTTIDFTDMYGSIGKVISEFVIYAWITLFSSFVYLVLTTSWIRRLLPY